MITHVMPSMGLALSNLVFENGQLMSAYVENGHWTLKRIGDNWIIGGREKPVDVNSHLVIIPKKYCRDYNAAINYTERHCKKYNVRFN